MTNDIMNDVEWLDYIEERIEVHINNQIKERKMYEKVLHKEHIKRQRSADSVKKQV